MGQIFFPINVEGPEGAKGDGEEALDEIFASEPGPVCEEFSKYGILVSVQGYPQASHVDVTRKQKGEEFWRCDAKTFDYPPHRKDRKPYSPYESHLL